MNLYFQGVGPACGHEFEYECEYPYACVHTNPISVHCIISMSICVRYFVKMTSNSFCLDSVISISMTVESLYTGIHAPFMLFTLTSLMRGSDSTKENPSSEVKLSSLSLK